MRQETLLIVDDEKGIRETIQAYGEREGYRMLLAHNGSEALEFFHKEAIDAVVLDWMLPDISGPEVMRTIREKSTVPVLMISARDDESDIVLGLELGADDYLRKPFGPRELLARVKALLRRSKEKVKEETSMTIQHIQINFLEGLVIKEGQEVTLTPNEYRILEVLAKHPDQLYSREELMGDALGYHGYVTDRTLDTHIKNLRKKLERDPKNPTLLLTVRERGYKLAHHSSS